MNDIVLLNDRPAPYRRDLRGPDLEYELMLLLNKLQPGDTLSIDRRAFMEHGARLANVIVPAYAHKRWVTDDDQQFHIRREGA